MEAKIYASAKSAKAAAKKAGVLDPVITEVGGRYRWSAPKPKRAVAKKAAAAGKLQREERNGVKMPGPGACREVWEYLSKHGDMMPAAIKAVAEQHGWNQNNASIELYQWRKFHGVKRPAKTA
jgi:hypothetical protein